MNVKKPVSFFEFLNPNFWHKKKTPEKQVPFKLVVIASAVFADYLTTLVVTLRGNTVAQTVFTSSCVVVHCWHAELQVSAT